MVPVGAGLKPAHRRSAQPVIARSDRQGRGYVAPFRMQLAGKEILPPLVGGSQREGEDMAVTLTLTLSHQGRGENRVRTGISV